MISDSTNKLKEMYWRTLQPQGVMPNIILMRDIDYEGFRQFMNTYFDVQTPEELCRHLFLSFVKRPRTYVQPKSIKEMAVVSSTTACAPITSHNTSGGSISNLAHCTLAPHEPSGLGGSPSSQTTSSGGVGGSFAEKLQGITEKLSSIGRSDSESVHRNRTGKNFSQINK
ncbi:Diacylglycerol kinase 1 [Armadillidium vulgare]|nr:Diacylglycerol kinase 1 [Armadillidium vulgare]